LIRRNTESTLSSSDDIYETLQTVPESETKDITDFFFGKQNQLKIKVI